MFQPFMNLLDTPEMAIDVIGEVITIKTPDDCLTCTPTEVLDSVRSISYAEFERTLRCRGESPAECIKNWYLRAL